ncbi:MAG: asparagine synthase (glutamine-hydrolyzing) [Thermodesulfovibrionales bacterium]
MCGIFGYIGNKGGADLRNTALLLRYRGPDAFGEYYDRDHDVYLAHCRLSIIDLSEDGKQPMSNEDGKIWITFNGEIYNFQELRQELEALGHRFRSQSDTEVIIHGYEQWGADCLKRFAGMFAFALWDKKAGTLFVARDRLGIKPLYYALINGNLAIASEPKAIVSLPSYSKAICYQALFSYMLYGYIIGEDSIWQGVKQLAPGKYFFYSPSKKELSINEYWRLEPQRKRWSEADALDRLEELLETSIRQHLVSDVPIGVLLSGGIDSTAITAYASAISPGIRSFSVGFEDWGQNELEDARIVARHFNTSHFEDLVRVDNFEELERLFSFYDEPLGDTSIFPTYLVCRNARRRTTVALSGDGGDELFGGYNWYSEMEGCEKWRRAAFSISGILRFLGIEKGLLARKCNSLDYYRLLTSPFFSLDELKTLFGDTNIGALPKSETSLMYDYYRGDLGRYKRWQYLDAMTYMPSNNLMRLDRASMAHSLEVRVPFLDHRIVEFAFSLPDDLCVRDGRKKYLLRNLLASKVPASVMDKPKQGFSCPVSIFWPVVYKIRDIKKGALVDSGIVNNKALDEIIRRRSDSNWELKIWLLAVLDKWCEHWLM